MLRKRMLVGFAKVLPTIAVECAWRISVNAYTVAAGEVRRALRSIVRGKLQSVCIAVATQVSSEGRDDDMVGVGRRQQIGGAQE